MENQHQKITGYRDLTIEEITSMNEIKEQAQMCGEMIETLRKLPDAEQRWVSIAQTQLQQGFMAAVRAIAKPTTF